MPDQDRWPNRWNEDRNARASGRRDEGGRPYGAGDYEYARGSAPRRAQEDRAWRPYDPGRDSPDWRDRSGLPWRGEARAPDLPQERHDERGLWSRTRDEMAAWFGDRHAEERRREDGEHRGRGPRGYRRADSRISDDIHDHLTEDSWLDASDIEVRVHEGEVTLTGWVRTAQDRSRADEIADRTAGVMRVHNHLHAGEGTAQGAALPYGFPP